MSTSTRLAIPWWLTVIIILETLPMFLGPVAAFNLPGFLGGPDAETINQATYIYAARNVAVGIALIVAYLLRSAPMLFILILIRLITDLIDLPTLLMFDLASNQARVIAIFVLLYYIPAIIALRYLWGQMKAADTCPPSASAT